MKILLLSIMFECIFSILPKKHVFYSKYYKKLHITPSHMQTKMWRQQQPWYIDGKRNECETYQKKLIKKITNHELEKTNKRIHIHSKQLYDVKHPMKGVNGFDYTENFDGILKNINKEYYFNLKVICNNGGAQVRSLRNVYHFVSYQLEHLLQYTEDIQYTHFINILDGDMSYKNMEKFLFLLDKDEYKNVQENIFIGDMKQFQDHWCKYD